MTTNLLIFPAEIPKNRIEANTSDTWGDTLRLNELNNNRCGPLGNLARLQTAKTGRTVVSYDMGANGAQVADHIAIARADLLQSDSVAALIVRQSEASAFAPSDISGCVAWFDPNTGVTVDADGGVSAWVDKVGSISASQSTAASRPILSRYDNKENQARYSEDFTNAIWIDHNSTQSANTIANPVDGAVTADTIIETAAVTTIHGVRYASFTTFSGVSYRFSIYLKAKERTFADINIGGSGFTSGDIFINLSAGTITSETVTGTPTIESVGNGWHRVSHTMTATSSGTPNFYILSCAVADNYTYTGDGTSGFYAYGFQIQRSSADTDYVSTTNIAQFSGINGSRAMHYDGTADYLSANALAASFSGSDLPMTIFTVHRSFDNSANKMIFSLGRNSSNTPLHLLRANSAAVKNAFRRDDASSSVNTNFGSSTTALEIFSNVFTGTDITLYVNGTLSGAANQAMNVGTITLDRASLMARDTGGAVSEYTGGYLAEVVIYNRALTTGERESVEDYLTAKYITAPLVADYALAPNSGEDTRNYVSTFADSSSRRYFWVEMESSASSKFTHSKLYLGDAIDFGETVDFIECIRRDDSNDDFEADSGAVDLASGKTGLYRISVTWKGITDAQLNAFLEKVAANAALRPGLFLHTTTNHQILDGHESIYVRLASNPVTERPKDDYNILTADFEEMPL